MEGDGTQQEVGWGWGPGSCGRGGVRLIFSFSPRQWLQGRVRSLWDNSSSCRFIFRLPLGSGGKLKRFLMDQCLQSLESRNNDRCSQVRGPGMTLALCQALRMRLRTEPSETPLRLPAQPTFPREEPRRTENEQGMGSRGW